MSKTTMANNKSSFDFSAAMAELEEITSYLESDDVALDDAMSKFKRGSELAKQIKTYLKEAENTITTIKSEL